MASKVKISRKLIENCFNNEAQLLIGLEDDDCLYILSCANLSDEPNQRAELIETFLPGGLNICGFAAPEKHSSTMKLKVCDNISQVVVMKKSGSGLDRVESVRLINSDNTEQSAEWVIEPLDTLASFVCAQTKCHIPLSFSLSQSGNWQTALHTEIDRLCENVTSESTMFHLANSSVLLNVRGCYGLPEGATSQSLADLGNTEDTGSRKKKEKKWNVVCFVVYTDMSSTCSLEKAPSCAPVINYKIGSDSVVNMMLKLETLSLFPLKQQASRMSTTLCTSLHRQLMAMRQCISLHSKDKRFVTPVPFQCQPLVSDAIFCVAYPYGVPDAQLEKERCKIHEYFCLPTDRPLFRRSNTFSIPDGQMSSSGYLFNVHECVQKSKVEGGCVCSVQGHYTYHHYMQDRFDDNKWGCAYRSLQTLVSWFKLQGYTETDIPTHKLIQQTLVDIGDKGANFVGSRKWIGSMEVSFVLETLLGVTSKIMSVSSGAELSSKGRELVAHFQNEGTPVMIGGGVLAHTILGVDYNETTGQINFLILDPHYTGAEDIKTIVDKGWCGWKGPEFWDQHAHYNLCMPQRPNAI